MTDVHFMIDIETTGVNRWTDEILEIGIVEMLPGEDGYWRPGREFQTFVHSNRAPISQFAREHMTEVYRKANDTIYRPAEVIREDIVKFFADCGKVGHDVLLCGWNASNFDMPMLHGHDFLEEPGYQTINGVDKQIGDHHYRVYEMCGALQLLADIKGQPYPVLRDEAQAAYDMPMPAGKAHDAIYDCHRQIKLLNGMIKLGRTP